MGSSNIVRIFVINMIIIIIGDGTFPFFFTKSDI